MHLDLSYIALFRKIYGITGVIDEYRLDQLRQVGSRLLAWLIAYLVIATLVVMELMTYLPQDGLVVGLVVSNVLVLWVVAAVGRRTVKRLHLNRLEVTAAGYPAALRQVRRQGFQVGGWTALVLVILFNLGTSGFWWQMSLAGVVIGALTGYDQYTTCRNQIHVVVEDR